MLDELKKELTSFKLLTTLLTIAVSIYLLQIFWGVILEFSDIIIILVIAWLLSFVLEPIVEKLAKLSELPKLFSALFVYLFFAILFSAMIFLFIPIVSAQLQSLSKVIPQVLSPYPSYLNTWNNAVSKSFESLIGFIPSLAAAFINIILILILSFYFILDKERINAEIYKLAPNSWHTNLKFIQKVIEETFSSFLQIQVIFGVIAGIATWIVLRIFSVDFAASVAFLSGILTIIPVIGPIIALIPPVFVVLAIDPNNITLALLILVILLLIQQIIFNIIGPKLMGRAFKLHPVIVFLSIIIGYKIAGAFGAIFAVPILGIAVVVLKQLGYHFINPTNR